MKAKKPTYQELEKKLAVAEKTIVDLNEKLATVGSGSKTALLDSREPEKAYIESEQNLRNILDASSLGIAIITESNDAVYANQALLDFCGYKSFEEFKAESIQKFYTPESYQLYQERQEKQRSGQPMPSEYEATVKRIDGEILNVRVILNEVTWGGERKIMVTYLDITEQKRAEEALKKSEEKFAKAFRSTPVLVSISNLEDGIIIETNDALVKRSGYSYEEIIGHSSLELDLWTIEERNRMVRILKEQGRIQNEIFQFRDKSGEVGWVDFSAEPIEIGGKKCLISVLLEITQRIRTQEALRQQAYIMEQVQDIVITTDIKGHILSWNRGAEKTFGYTAAEALGKHVSFLAAPGQFGELSKHQSIGPNLEKGIHESDIETLTKSGEKKIIHLSLSPIRDKQSITTMMCGYGIDVTERRKAEKALAESEFMFSTSFHNSPSMLAITTLKESRIIEVNDVFCLVSGYTRDELIGHTTADLTLWNKAEQRDKLLQHLQNTEQVRDMEVEVRTKSGDIRTVVLSASVISLKNEPCLITSAIDITERKQTEKALFESQMKVWSIFSAAPIGIGVLVGRVLKEVNQKFCEMLGYSRDEILGCDGRMIYPDDDEYERVGGERDAGISSRGSAVVEATLKCKDGKKIDVIMSYSPIVSGDLSQGITVTALDITGHKQTENALKESEEKFSKAFRSSPEAVSITTYDSDAIILDTNETACKNTGYSYDELIGHSVYELGLWADPEESEEMRRILKEKGSVHAEIYKFRIKSGEIRTWEFSAEPIEIGGKKCIISVQSDITERIKAEEALKERDQKIRTIFSMAPIGIGMVSGGVITEVNEEYCNIVGYTRDELINQSPVMVYPSAEEYGYTGRTLQPLVESTGFGIVETRFKHKNGSIRDITLSCAALDKTDLLKGIVFTVVDVTERKKANQALMESEERFRTLFETMAQGVVYQEPDGKIALTNPAARQILGLAPRQIQGRTSVDKRWKALRNDGTEFPGEQHPAMVALRTRRPIRDVVMGVYNPVDNDYRWIMIDAIPEFRTGEKKPYRVYTLFRDITVRRQLEEKIRYQADLIQTVSDAIVSSDNDYKLVSWNKAAEELYGWREEEVIGKNVLELLKAELTTPKEEVEALVNKRGYWQGESVHYTRDGRRINTMDSVTNKRDVYGNHVGTVAVYKDITARKQLEEKIRYQADLIQTVSDAIVSSDKDYKLVSWNRAAEELYGWREEEVIGKNIFDVLKAELSTSFEDIQISMDKKGYWQGESVHYTRDGKKLSILDSVSMKRDADGNNVGAVSVFKDITARKQLEESVQYQASLIENILDAIISGDQEYKILSWNRAAEEMYGWKKEEVLGKHLQEIIKPITLNATIKDVEDSLTEKGYWNGEAIHYRKDGSELNVLESISVKRDTRGKNVGAVIVYKDITRRKKMEESLRHYADLVENVSDAIISAGAEMKLISWNKAAEEIFGWTREEVLGRVVTEFLPTHFLGVEVGYVDNILNKYGKWSGESIHYRKDGKKIDTLESITRTKDDKGDFKESVTIFKDVTERKKLEESVRYHAGLLENVLDAIVSADTEYKILSWNGAAEELYGWKKEEVLGKSILGVLKPDTQNATQEALRDSLAEKGYWTGEAVHQRKDGSKLNVLESISIRKDEKGKNIGAVMVFKDNTQRKKMEENLRHYADLVESVSDAIIYVDNEMTFISWNKAAEDLFGWSREEVLGKNIMEFLPPLFLGADLQHVEDMLVKDGKWSGESIHHRKDGKKIDTLESITLTKNENGEKRGTVTIFRDITESKRMTEELAKEATRRRILVEQSRDGIVILDQDGRLTEANRRFIEMLGYSPEEARNLHVWDWDTRWSKEQLLEQINAITETGDHFETYHQRKDSTVFDVEISTNAATFGTQKFVFCVCRDITERKRLEENIRYQASLVENVSDAVISSDLSFKILSWNKAAENLYGWKKEEVIGQNSVDVLQPFFTNTDKDEVLAFLRKNGYWRGEAIHHRKDGRQLNVLISVSPIEYEKGKVKGVVTLCTDITERKKMEESIRYHASLVDNVSDAVISSDMKYLILSWNKAAEKMYGWTEKEVIGKSVMEVTDPVFLNTDKDEILQLLRKNGAWRGEAIHHRKDGKPINVLISISLMKDEQGKETGAVTIFTDITERKQAEEKHQTILETALDGFHILDMDGKIIEVNDSYCRMTGYTRDELLNMYISDVEANKNTGPLVRIVKMPEKGNDRFETKHVCKDGRIIDLEVTLNYLDIGDGQVFSFLHDITDRKRYEDRINLLNMTLRSIRNVNQLITREKDRNKLIQGVCNTLVESRGIIKSWIALFDNTGCLNTHAVSGTEKDFETIGALLKKGELPQCVDKALRRNTPVVTQSHDKVCRGCPLARNTSDYGSIAIKLHYSDKTYGVLGVSAPSNIVTDKDEVGLYEEVAMDIAFALYNIELEAEHEILDQERMRVAKLESIGTLAGGIAHDFNNLLTGILGNIGMAKLSIKPAEPTYELLDEAERATVRTRDLTQQLLTFARGGKPVKKMVDISTLIKETATFSLRGSRVKLELSLPEKLWQIEADEGQISQVIQNLVINAEEAMLEGGILSIDAANIAIDKVKSLPLKTGNYIVINVKDTGVGMSKEQLQRVFEPYYTTKQRGSGLGLTSAFSIIRNHNGYLFAESTPGKGSTFHVYLPASKKTAKGGKKMTAEKAGKVGGKILVMDDEPIIQRMLKQMLTVLGYEAVITADGATAVDQYSRAFDAGSPFDVVIMDLTIPGGMGGKEAVKKLLEKDPDARVVVSSGYATDPIMSEYKKYGFSAVVAKPYTVHHLEETLSDLIKKKKN